MSTILSSVRLLVVDDNQHMRAIISTVLKGIGVRQVRECWDGAEALDALRKWPADVVITDYHMAPIDGIEFTRLVRNAADSPNPFIPIIMLTGYAERTLVMEARDAGVTEFIAKPLTAQALVDRLGAVVFRPRSFVRTSRYFGPDRRRRDDPSYDGPLRRSGDDDMSETGTG
jgi:two-component system, chemotaxis family, chemotaxis protein CheY